MDSKDKPTTDYCETKVCADETPPAPVLMGWKELYLKEDWWAIYLGIGLMFFALIAFSMGSNAVKLLAINPGGVHWTSLGQLMGHFQQNLHLYMLQFLFWLVIFGVSTSIMGIKLSKFIPSFIFLYILSVMMFSISGWANAAKYNLEPPLVALIVGLILANLFPLPKWLDAGFRVEYFIKTGIVLLGATFPVTLIVTAGPIALLQATIISVTTCLVIYFVATKFFGLDKRLASVISVGGSVCGVSASMAIASSVKAKTEYLYTSVTLVVGWALVMIIVLPFVSKLLGLAPGVAGAWIGTSEFADAAGFAAASAYGKMSGNENAAIQGFTLMKVIGRDMWIGIWSFVFAMIACLKWEKEECGVRPSAMEIWWRFPKFVIGFFLATFLMTAVTAGYSTVEFNSSIKPNLIQPLVSIRSWTFIFCFLSIGLTTRFRDLKAAGLKPFAAFTTGVVVNVILGFVMSVYVFGSYWSALGK
ncbi:conserved membrane hypothetical protein [Syntrophobacter sp. SbD1]|nr:conserved membrane hypothetical protein [Syntrophobacter sp. SbD1]